MSVAILESLNTKEQALLVMFLLFSSREFEDYLIYLPEDESNNLKAAANILIKLERSNRIQFLVAHLKQLLVYQKESPLLSVDPSWILHFLSRENSFISECVVKALPVSLLRTLKLTTGTAAPDETMQRVLLQYFTAQFEKMPFVEFNQNLTFQQLILLTAKDLIILLKYIGQRAMATAFAKMGLKDTAQLLSNYDDAMQNQIISALKDVKATDSLDENQVDFLLEAILPGFHNVEDLFQRAGLYFLASAILPEDYIFAKQLAQRMPYVHGQMLLDYGKFNKDNNFAFTGDELRQQLILATVIDLAKAKKIDGRFAECVLNS